MITQKSYLKAILSTCITLCFTIFFYGQVSAFDAIKEAKSITKNPELIYTMYIGMPRSDVEQNFSNIKGWEIVSDNTSFWFRRNYSDWKSIKSGASLTQAAFAQFDKTNHIRSMMNRFDTDSKRYALEIYNTMYNQLIAQYGEPSSVIIQSETTRLATWDSGKHKYNLSLLTIWNYDRTINYYSIDLIVGL